jgi:hypothetical protein
MRPKRKPISRLIMLFSAVAVFQCCCCILPYSLESRFPAFSLGAPFQRQEEIYVPPARGLKTELPVYELEPATLISQDCFWKEDIEAQQAREIGLDRVYVELESTTDFQAGFYSENIK